MKLIGCSLSIFVRIVLPVVLACLLAWFVCDIEPGHKYHWIGGLWHGIFVIPNFIRNLLNHNVLYIADKGTDAYTVFYWIFTISTLITFASSIVKTISKIK